MRTSLLNAGRRLVAVASLALLTLPTTASGQVTFQLIDTLDAFTLNTGNPGSIAAYGDDLFVGTLFSGAQITRITDPLGTPTNAGAVGSGGPVGATTNGYVSLYTDGTNLAAATNNGGFDPDVLQVFDVATGALNFSGDSSPGSLDIGGDRIDGAAIDPLTGDVLVTAFNSATQHLFDPLTGADAADTPSVFDAEPPASTGWRDITFNRATGDIYLRGTNGIAAGLRNGADDEDDYLQLNPFATGDGAGISKIAGSNGGFVQDSFQSAINIEFLPASFTGDEDIVITNTRVSGSQDFTQQVLAFDANAGFDGTDPFSFQGDGVAVPLTFLDSDGVSPFTTTGSGSGIYDFSYDPVNEVLYVSSLSNGEIYIFGEPGPPASLDGDFNGDGTVDGADYTAWRDNFGVAPSPLANDPTPQGVGNDDYTTWVDNFGTSSASGVAAIPEPTAAALALAAAGLLAGRRRG